MTTATWRSMASSLLTVKSKPCTLSSQNTAHPNTALTHKPVLPLARRLESLHARILLLWVSSEQSLQQDACGWAQGTFLVASFTVRYLTGTQLQIS